MYRLEPGEPIGPGLQRIWWEKVSESNEILRNFSTDPKLAVHSLRKNVKRIRALLRLARIAIGPEVYRSDNYMFRDIGRLFGGLRDSSVLYETALLLEAADPDEPPQFPTILERLAVLSDSAYHQQERIAAAVAEALERFEAASGRLGALRIKGSSAIFFEGYFRTVRAALKRYHRAVHEPAAAENFHEWRKQVKYVWHQLEILAPAADPPVEDLTGDVQHLAGLLGQAHDAAALQAWLSGSAGAFPGIEAGELENRLRRYRLDQEGAAFAHGSLIFGRRGENLLSPFTGFSDYRVPSDR